MEEETSIIVPKSGFIEEEKGIIEGFIDSSQPIPITSLLYRSIYRNTTTDNLSNLSSIPSYEHRDVRYNRDRCPVLLIDGARQRLFDKRNPKHHNR